MGIVYFLWATAIAAGLFYLWTTHHDKDMIEGNL